METTQQARPRAAIYCRISSDPEGLALGVERQEVDCRALAARLGLEVVRVFVENDTGASTKSKKARPLYKEMIDGARAGIYDAILAYSASRITRRPAEWEDLIRLYETVGTMIHTVMSGTANFSTADGRATARTVAAWDAAEAERTAERVQRAKADSAAKGKWRGGRRPFGYEADGVTIRPDEAAALERAADAIIAGRSLGAAAREINESGLTTTSKNLAMDVVSLRNILLRPRNAGLMEVNGEITGKAQWAAVIPEDKWLALRGILTDPSRRTQNGSERRWLGSGLFRCGTPGCGGVVRAAVTSGEGRVRRLVYRCKTSSGHVNRDMYLTDAVVEIAVRDYLRDEQDALRAKMTVPAPHRKDVEKLRADLRGYRERLKGLPAEYAGGRITDWQMVLEARSNLEGQIEEVEQKLTALTTGNVLGETLTAADPGQMFLDADLDRRRAIIDALAVVTIRPARRGRPVGHVPGKPYFDPKFIDVDFGKHP
ncbi:recombinase family protein [Pseudarthrobacter sp. fls2-241-R2A-127]|uniref:recombinase family protein n=1 Tax=Pseudarthrobacter sp. fls2-241-R2A-127 TaxID=3040303 RepID=UPI00255516C9|nr:recombinase family protein [Pseudarthrobacter sp. fls2-241-R2A-127]